MAFTRTWYWIGLPASGLLLCAACSSTAPTAPPRSTSGGGVTSTGGDAPANDAPANDAPANDATASGASKNVCSPDVVWNNADAQGGHCQRVCAADTKGATFTGGWTNGAACPSGSVCNCKMPATPAKPAANAICTGSDDAISGQSTGATPATDICPSYCQLNGAGTWNNTFACDAAAKTKCSGGCVCNCQP